MSRPINFHDSINQEKKASFFVRILFRHNGTIQGELQWLEGQRTQHFRSAMELVALMDEAAACGGIVEGEPERRHWVSSTADRSRSVESSVRRRG